MSLYKLLNKLERNIKKYVSQQNTMTLKNPLCGEIVRIFLGNHYSLCHKKSERQIRVTREHIFTNVQFRFTYLLKSLQCTFYFLSIKQAYKAKKNFKKFSPEKTNS